MKNPVGFARRHIHNLDRWLRRKATAYSVETICLARVRASFLCIEDKESARISTFGGEELMKNFLENHLRKGDIVYDIGANIGFYSVFFAKKVGENGKVFAFEPETINFERLRANADLNCLGNLIACPFAASSQTQLAFLKRHSNEAGEGAHAVTESADKNSIPIFCFSLDFLAKQFQLPPPTVIKIDIEGHEVEALAGMKGLLSGGTIRTAFIEIHYWQQVGPERRPYKDEEQKEFRERVVGAMALGNLNLIKEQLLVESGLSYGHTIFRRSDSTVKPSR